MLKRAPADVKRGRLRSVAGDNCVNRSVCQRNRDASSLPLPSKGAPQQAGRLPESWTSACHTVRRCHAERSEASRFSGAIAGCSRQSSLRSRGHLSLSMYGVVHLVHWARRPRDGCAKVVHPETGCSRNQCVKRRSCSGSRLRYDRAGFDNTGSIRCRRVGTRFGCPVAVGLIDGLTGVGPARPVTGRIRA